VQKPGLIIVIFGLLIVAGLVVSMVENQVRYEGINQENGKVSSIESFITSVDIDKEKSPIGIFNIKIMEFQKNAISAKILDPSNIEIVFEKINKESIEKEFDVFESGTYQLIIESSIDNEINVVGKIGSLPDADNIFILSIISFSVTIVGMIGIAAIAIVGIKNRNKSV